MDSALERRRQRRTLLGALAAGALARALCAWLATTFHSRDDYHHVLQPALLWLQDPAFDWEHSGLPGAGYRSHLLPRLCTLALRALRALGVEGPLGQLRGLGLLMGLYSLWLVPAMAQAGRVFFDRRTARIAAWAAALYFPFPYVGTRLLIEGLAMPPLLVGLSASVAARASQVVGGGMLLGLACWWRPQVCFALIGLVAGLWRWQAGRPAAAVALPWRQRLGCLAAGFTATMALQIAWDALTTHTFLGPLRHNVALNLAPSSNLSRSAPSGYLGLLLLLSLPPATLWLLPAAWAAARRAAPLGLSFASFFLAHSLIAHKEDRFLIPALPLLALLGATAASKWRNAWHWWLGRRLILVLGAAALAFSVTSQSQQNLRDCMLTLRDDPQARGVVSLGPEMQTFFLQRTDVGVRQHDHFDEAWFLRQLAQLQADGHVPNRFVCYAPDRLQTQLYLRLIGFSCTVPTVLEGWWFDRLLFRLNPRRNRRRSPVHLYRCRPPAQEVAWLNGAPAIYKPEGPFKG